MRVQMVHALINPDEQGMVSEISQFNINIACTVISGSLNEMWFLKIESICDPD